MEPSESDGIGWVSEGGTIGHPMAGYRMGIGRPSESDGIRWPSDGNCFQGFFNFFIFFNCFLILCTILITTDGPATVPLLDRQVASLIRTITVTVLVRFIFVTTWMGFKEWHCKQQCRQASDHTYSNVSNKNY